METNPEQIQILDLLVIIFMTLSHYIIAFLVGGKCQWELQIKQVINEIADSEDSNEQMFKFLERASCATFAQCELQCKRLSVKNTH